MSALRAAPAAEAHNGQSSRSTLALLAWSSGVFRTFATMAGGFIATPYVLRYLGPERLGAFRTAQQWTGYLPYLYFGLGPALTVLMLKATSKGDLKQASALVKGGLKLEFRQTIILVLPAAIMLALFMPSFMPANTPLQRELRVGVLIYTISVLLSPLEVFRNLLECLQRGYLVNIGLAVQALFVMALSVSMAWLGWGVAGQFIALVAGAASFSLLVWNWSTKLLTGLRASSAAEISPRRLWRLRAPMTITGIGGQINLLTDYIVLSMVSNPGAVTTFSITQRLVTVLAGFVTMLTAATWAGLAEIRSQASQQLFQDRMIELVRLVVGFGGVILATLAAFNIHFVRLWVGEPYYGGNLLTILTALQSLMLAFFTLFTWTIDLQGDTRYRVPITSSGAVVNLILSFILGRRLGMYGITLATLIGYSLTEVWFNPYLFSKRYAVSFGALAGAAFKSLFLALPWAIAVWVFAHSRFPSNWPAFGLEFGITCSVGLFYFWFVILVRSDRARWRVRCEAAIRATVT